MPDSKMTDEQILNALRSCGDHIAICDGCPYYGLSDCSLRAKRDIISRFEELKAENEALNSKLSQSQPLPCKVGDIVYTVTLCFGDGFAANGEHISKSGYFMQKIEVTERNLYRICELFRMQKAYFTPEAAKLRLKELPNFDLLQGLQGDIE